MIGGGFQSWSFEIFYRAFYGIKLKYKKVNCKCFHFLEVQQKPGVRIQIRKRPVL